MGQSKHLQQLLVGNRILQKDNFTERETILFGYLISLAIPASVFLT